MSHWTSKIFLQMPSVLSLWLTMTTSFSSRYWSSYLSSAFSLRLSRLLVGSSNNSTLELCRKALAKLILYFSPLLSLSPSSPTWVSNCSGSELMKSNNPALSAASIMSILFASALPTLMFSAMVPLNKIVSYSTRLYYLCRSSIFISFKSVSFIVIFPLYGS